MKSLFASSLPTLAASALFFAVGSTSVNAANFTWDTATGDGATITAGSGAWNTTDTNWNNGSTNVAWSQTSATAATNAAIFGGEDGTYTVTLSGTTNAQSVAFNSSGYTLTSGTLTLKQSTSANGSITVAAGKTATINSSLSYNQNVVAAVTVGSGGTLNLGGGTSGAPANPIFNFSGDGTINLVGGTFSNNSTSSNNATYGNAVINLTSGTHAITPGNNGGANISSNARNVAYNLSGGALSVIATGTADANAHLAIGNTTGAAFTSTLNVISGTMVTGTTSGRAGEIQIAKTGSSNGTLNVSGGAVTIGTGSTNNKIYFFKNGSAAGYTANMTQTSGTVTANGIQFGGTAGTYDGTSSANMTLSGGALHVGAQGIARGSAANDLPVVIKLQSGTIGASAAWSSSLNMKIGTITIRGGTPTSANNITLLGVLSDDTGPGAITKTGSGTLALSGSNTFSGGVTIMGGTLESRTTQTTLGSGTVTMGGAGSTGATFITGQNNSNPFVINTPDSGSVVIGANGNGSGFTLSGGITLNGNLTLQTFDNPISGSTKATAGITGGVTGTGNLLLNNLGLAANTITITTNAINHTGSITLSGTAATGDTAIGSIIGPNVTSVMQNSATSRMVLSGNNAYTGATSINAGTLALGASNVLPNATAVSIGAATLDSATYTDTAGTLDPTGAATINLGAGAALAFADSSAVDWAGGTLNITGSFVSGASLRFGTTRDGLTAAQLGKITATGISNFGLNESGYLIEAFPEIAVEQPAETDIANNGTTDFGNVGLGLNNSLTFTIRNSGDLALSLTNTPLVAIGGTNAADFEVTTQPDASVAAKGTTTFTVKFAPSALGTRNAQLSIASDDSDENPFVINLSGTAVLPPEIAIEEPAGTNIANNDSKDFGTVGPGLNNSLTFTIRNSGDLPLDLTGSPRVAIGGTNAADFEVTTQPDASVAAKGTTTFTVKFAPSESGPRSAQISIANNDTTKNPFVINISGTRSGPQEIAVEQPTGTNIANNGTKDFGNVGLGLTSSLAFTVRNNGDLPLNLSGAPRVAISGSNAADFTVIVDPDATIAAAGTTTFTVEFAPSISGVAGARSAQLSIANNDSDENPFVINLSGTAVLPPEIAVEEQSGTNIANNGTKDFGNVGLGLNNSLTFTIRNSGDLPLNLSGVPLVAISGTNAADFTVTTQPNATIAAKGSTTFTVRFAPSTEVGPRIAKLSIANNDSDENPFVINLSGTAVLPPEIAVEQDSINIVTSGTQAFGNVGLGFTNSLTFTIRNSGDLPLSLTNTPQVAISGTNAADFTVTTQPDATIAAKGSTTFTVRFAPSTEVGPRIAKLSIANNDSDENPFEINLSGTGILPPEIAVEQAGGNIASGSSKDFGTAGIGFSNSLTFTIRNTGAADLNLTGTPRVAISGAHKDEFTVTSQPNASVAGAGTTTFEVKFAPNAVGARSAALTIANNDTDEGSYVINLTGTSVLPPDIAVEQPANTGIASGGSKDFGTVAWGSSKSLTFTVRNTGLGGLSLTNLPRVVVGGTHSADFLVTAFPASYVAPGGSTTFTVQFNPKAAGERNATLTIANNDFGDESPYVINIKGTGSGGPQIAVEQPAANVITSGGTSDFGTVMRNSSKSLTFTVRNSGTGYLYLTGTPRVKVSGADASNFTIGVAPASSVAGGSSTSFTVQFAPNAKRLYNATLMIDNEVNGSYVINLTGIGDSDGDPQIAVEQPAANVILSGGTRDFGTVMRDSSKSLTFTVRNSGAGYLYLTGTPRVKITGADAANFAVSVAPASSVAGGSSTSFTVQFVPSAKRLHNAVLTIDTEANGSYIINLTGTGDGDPEIAVEQAGNNIANGGSQDFARVSPGSSKSLTFIIRNTGNIALNLTRNPGEPLVNISGYDKDSFVVTASPATTVAVGGSTNFTVQFTPSSEAPHGASLSISNNDGDENPFVISLSGNPVAEIAVEQPIGTDISNNGSQNFGSVDIGSTNILTFTIRNSGGLDMSLTGSPLVAISGTNASDFTVTTQPPSATVAAKGSATFTVQFAPSALGVRNAQLAIANDDSNENPFVINLSGTGTGASEIAIEQVIDTEIASGGTQSFGSVLLGYDTDLTFTIRNSGDRPLNLTGTPLVAISGTNAADFTVTTQPAASIAANDSAAFTVRFAPSALGARYAQLSIANNDSNENPYVINLSGTAVDQLLFGSDHAGNYGSGWTNGSNGGTGFGPWTITSSNGASGFAGAFIGDPASAGITGMPSTSFGLYANPTSSGAYVNADRSFANPLGIGDSFSFQWSINWDSGSSGNKGFNLYSGGTQLINVNNAGSSVITINDTNIGFSYGTAAMTWTITRTSATNLKVDATSRDGGASYSGNFAISGDPDAFRFYASNMQAGDQAQPYFNNLQLTKLAIVASPQILGLLNDPFDDYMTNFGLSGSDALGAADPDGDGQSNDAEFAFGTDPSNGSGQQTSVVEEPGAIKLVYLQRDSGVTYTVKSFTDLSTPFDDGVELTPTASNPQPPSLPEGYTQYEATLSTAAGKGFLRVKAVR